MKRITKNRTAATNITFTSGPFVTTTNSGQMQNKINENEE